MIAPFASFQDSDSFDPVGRLLNQYQLPEFLKKALWLSRGGSQCPPAGRTRPPLERMWNFELILLQMVMLSVVAVMIGMNN